MMTGMAMRMGKMQKGLDQQNSFACAIVLFCTFLCPLLHNKKTIFVFLVKEKFANILQIENDGIRGMEFETNM